MNVRLVVVQGRPEGMEIPLPMPQFLIGRDPRCQLRPSSELISKLHCAILQRDDGVFVRDLKSTNGTFVNNDRLEGEVAVHDGDLLKVGPIVFAIKIPVGAAVAKEPSSGSAEDQAVTWLLDYTPSGERKNEDLGSKTTIMDMRLSETPPAAASQAEEETKDTTPAPKEPASTKKKVATAEVAGDLLEKLLTPPRKKKR